MAAPIIDCLTVITPLAAHAMKGSGVRGCVLYVDRTLPNSKNAVLGAGLELASNYETTGRSGTGGRASGIREATRLIELHVAAGGPSGIVLWLSPFDFDMRDVQTAQDYIDGAVSVLHPLRYKAGFYGSAGLGQNTHGWDAWWQCESTGYWNNRYPWGGAAIVQRVPLAASFAGVQTDGNLLQQPDNWGSWSTSVPTPTPVHQEALMSLTVIDFKNPATDRRRKRFVRLIPQTGQFVLVPYNGAKIVGASSNGVVTQPAHGTALGVEPDPNGVDFVVTYDDGGTFAYRFAT